MAQVSFQRTDQLEVGLCFNEKITPVGRLALRKKKIYFEYDASFLQSKLEISPLKCPLRPGVQMFDPHLFEGLPGVFDDSLPDGWGRLLFDRKMRSEGIALRELSALDRLACVGNDGMGALVYRPNYSAGKILQNSSLDDLAGQAAHVLSGEACAVLAELLALNGSSAGARPKAMIGVSHDRQKITCGMSLASGSFEPWLVKFPGAGDGLDAGAIEYVYALMAFDAGVEMQDVHLFSAQQGPGYFATKRFDRQGKKRLHCHSVAGLLHADFRTPSLDYEDLLLLTAKLTGDVREVETMFRLAAFNVLAHNRDDHAKNFSFLMDSSGQWKLSPAYDLTFSFGPGGEHSTMVMGEGKNPGKSELLKLGGEAGMPEAFILAVIEQTKTALGKWRELATGYAVAKTNIDLIESKMAQVQAFC